MRWRIRHLLTCKHRPGCLLCQLLRHPENWCDTSDEGPWLYYIVGAWLLLGASLLFGR
jgi:hypothetical protein